MVRRAAGGAAMVATWVVILAALVVLAVAVVLPRLAGATPYTVLTGSMKPTLPPGTLAVVRPVDFDDLRIGDVVTYQLESGRPAVVTHRVVGIGTSLQGAPRLTTQGDANDVADAEKVRPEQVRGRLWYAVPRLGRISNLLDPDQRQLGVYGIAAALLVYSGWMFGSAAVGRRRTSDGTETSHDPTRPTDHTEKIKEGAS